MAMRLAHVGDLSLGERLRRWMEGRVSREVEALLGEVVGGVYRDGFERGSLKCRSEIDEDII